MTTITAKSIKNTINQAFDDILERHPDITDKHSKTAGIGLYVSDRKFLQISENTRDRIEFLILRDPDKDYCRPQYGDLDIRNIRKYDPSQESYIRPWGYMFYRVLVIPEQYLDNKNILDQLINRSYEIAKEEKILKVSKSDHEQLAPIFEGIYIFEENDEANTSTEETSDISAEHADPVDEELEEVEIKENDESSSEEIVSEDEVEKVESEEISSMDEKEVVADEISPDKRVFNYINNDPQKTDAILKRMDIETLVGLIKSNNLDVLETIYSLLSENDRGYIIPKEYVIAFIDEKISSNDFEKLIKSASEKWSSDVMAWPTINVVLNYYKEYDNNIVITVDQISSIEFGYEIRDDWDIKAKRIVELLQSPITPVLGMNKKEAELIFGLPDSDEADVMKTKTVVTWTYLKQSQKINRKIQALELKFQNDELVRYVDKRDDTYYYHALGESSLYLYMYPESTHSYKIEKLQMYIAFRSLFQNDAKETYIDNEDKIIELLVTDKIDDFQKLISDLKKRIKKIRTGSDYGIRKLEKEIVICENIFNRPIVTDTWNMQGYPFPRFENGSKLFSATMEEVSLDQRIIEARKELETLITTGKELISASKIKKEVASEKKSGCFIATATLGDSNHPTVHHLREFRNLFLLKRSWGVSFIRYYYHYGPYPARIIGKSPFLKFASYLIIIKPITIITKRLLRNENN